MKKRTIKNCSGKYCDKATKPLTAENFGKNKSNKHRFLENPDGSLLLDENGQKQGAHQLCKPCRSNYMKESKERKEQRQVNQESFNERQPEYKKAHNHQNWINVLKIKRSLIQDCGKMMKKHLEEDALEYS